MSYQPLGQQLTPHEKELVTILMEEAGEVVVAASKLLRFGKEHRPAEGTDPGVPNTRYLALEVGDLEYMVLIRESEISEGAKRKKERLD